MKQLFLSKLLYICILYAVYSFAVTLCLLFCGKFDLLAYPKFMIELIKERKTDPSLKLVDSITIGIFLMGYFPVFLIPNFLK
jgi:hypothetical protein